MFVIGACGAGTDGGASAGVRVGPALRADGPGSGAWRMRALPRRTHCRRAPRPYAQHPRARQVAAAARYCPFHLAHSEF
jgi:hypothetical protein